MAEPMDNHAGNGARPAVAIPEPPRDAPSPADIEAILACQVSAQLEKQAAPFAIMVIAKMKEMGVDLQGGPAATVAQNAAPRGMERFFDVAGQLLESYVKNPDKIFDHIERGVKLFQKPVAPMAQKHDIEALGDILARHPNYLKAFLPDEDTPEEKYEEGIKRGIAFKVAAEAARSDPAVKKAALHQVFNLGQPEQPERQE